MTSPHGAPNTVRPSRNAGTRDGVPAFAVSGERPRSAAAHGFRQALGCWPLLGRSAEPLAAGWAAGPLLGGLGSAFIA
jgi:hypothetical protein